MRASFIGTAASLGTALLLLALSTGCSHHHCRRGGGEEKGVPHGECGGHKGECKMLKRLDLTPDQEQKIDAQRRERREAMTALYDSLKAKHEELNAELDKETTDKARIDSITADMKKIENQRIDLEVGELLQMKSTLTPEQFKKLRKVRKGGRRGCGGEGGQCGHGGGEKD